MKGSTVCCLAALFTVAWVSSGNAAAPYFPYDTIEEYYKTKEPSPSPAPPGQQPPATPVPPVQRKGEPAIAQAPEFLFPQKLGFGVAVGVPYDLMYLAGTYYLWQGEGWYRSNSYHGPWLHLVYTQLPPELRKQSLAQIRKARNSEFKTYWSDKEHYQGKRFRPGRDPNPPARKEEPER